MYGYLKGSILSNTQTPSSGNAAVLQVWVQPHEGKREAGGLG